MQERKKERKKEGKKERNKERKVQVSKNTENNVHSMSRNPDIFGIILFYFFYIIFV